MDALIPIAHRCYTQVLHSLIETDCGTDECARHLSTMNRLNKAVGTLKAGLDDPTTVVAYGTVQWTAERLNEAVPTVEVLNPASPMQAMLDLEAALRVIEDGPAMDMRKSAKAARLSAYSALSTGSGQAFNAYLNTLGNTAKKYGGLWMPVIHAAGMLLRAMGGEAPTGGVQVVEA